MSLIIGICITWFRLPTSIIIFPLVAKCVNLNRVSCSPGDHNRPITQTPLVLCVCCKLSVGPYTPLVYSPHDPSLQRPTFISWSVCLRALEWFHTTDGILATKLRNVFLKFNEQQQRRIVVSSLSLQQQASWMTKALMQLMHLQRTMRSAAAAAVAD